MERNRFYKQIRAWLDTAPLPFPQSVPEMEELLDSLGVHGSPIQAPLLITSATETNRKADILFQLHDRILQSDDDSESDSVRLFEVTYDSRQFSLALDCTTMFEMLFEDLYETTPATFIRFAWFIDVASRREAMRKFLNSSRHLAQLWALNDGHLQVHEHDAPLPEQCAEHRRITLAKCECERRTVCMFLDGIRKILIAKIQETLKKRQLLQFSDKHKSTGRDTTDSPVQESTGSPVQTCIDSPVQKSKRVRKPKNLARDEVFVRLADDGKLTKEISAYWNSIHPKDNVGDEAVKKAIQRYRKRPPEGDTVGDI
jgi:hypothetical protein